MQKNIIVMKEEVVLLSRCNSSKKLTFNLIKNIQTSKWLSLIKIHQSKQSVKNLFQSFVKTQKYNHNENPSQFLKI